MNQTIQGIDRQPRRLDIRAKHHQHSKSMPSLGTGEQYYSHNGLRKKKMSSKRLPTLKNMRSRQFSSLINKTHAAHAPNMPGSQWGNEPFKGPPDRSDSGHSGEVQARPELYTENKARITSSTTTSTRHQSLAPLPDLQRPQISMSFTLPSHKARNNIPPIPRRSHTSLAPQHVCAVCSRRFRRLITLEIHQKVLHPWTVRPDGSIIEGKGRLPFVCKEKGCGKSFCKRKQYFAHVKLHTGNQCMVCTNCGKRILVRRTQTKHQRVHLSLYPPFDCVCGRRFKTNDALQEHLEHREVHRPFVCICGQPFRQQMTIKVRADIRPSALENMTEVGKRWTQISFV
jgi:hypothetical protein